MVVIVDFPHMGIKGRQVGGGGGGCLTHSSKGSPHCILDKCGSLKISFPSEPE